MKLSLFLIFIVLVAAEARPKYANDELIAVAVLFRHGDRTIIETYPNDPYKDRSNWPVGWGQLTNTGRTRLKTFGRWIQERYHQIINKHVHVQSTNTVRTKDSAREFLDALYAKKPNVDVQIMNWRDNYLLDWNITCPKYAKLKHQHVQHLINELKATDEYKGVFEYCSEMSGKEATDMEYFEFLHGVLEIEDKQRNFTLPLWTRKVYPVKTSKLSGMSFATHSGTTELARLKTGPFWHLILDNFKNLLENKTGFNLWVYSGHDVSISNVLESLKVFDGVPPKYVSSVIIELWKSGSENYILIYYKVDDDLRNVVVECCGSSCDLYRFKECLKPITVDVQEWKLECNQI